MVTPPKEPRNVPAVSTPVAYGLMFFTVFIWASSFAGIRYMLDRMDAVPFTALRLTIGCAAMLVGALLARIELPRREHLRKVVIAGFFGFTGYHLALNFGAARVTAGQAAFVTATIPVWTAFAAWRVLGEQVSGRHWIGLLVSIVGIGVMSLEPSDVDVPIGSVLVLLAALFAAANIVIQKGLIGEYRPFDLTTHVAVIGSLPLILWLPTQTSTLAELDTTAWIVVLYLGVGPIALGYWLSTIALKALPAYRTSQFLLLIPPIAAVIAWIALGEVPTARMLFGGVIVLAGVAVTIRRRRRGSSSAVDSA